jgi:hypothetical protein
MVGKWSYAVQTGPTTLGNHNAAFLISPSGHFITRFKEIGDEGERIAREVADALNLPKVA